MYPCNLARVCTDAEIARVHHLALWSCHLVRVRAHYASVESIEVKLKELNDMIKN